MVIHILSKTALDRFSAERAELAARRPEAVENLRRAREMGDLSENAAYKVARQMLSQLDSRLRFLYGIIRNAKVLESDFSGKVTLGTEVTLEGENKTVIYRIVDTVEADPAKGMVSAGSPIGQAVMGKREKEAVTVTTPSGTFRYLIKGIRPVP